MHKNNNLYKMYSNILIVPNKLNFHQNEIFRRFNFYNNIQSIYKLTFNRYY